MGKLRNSARGRECQVRIPGICNGNPETVVLAHLNGGGMGMKRHDIHGAYACSACHDAVDGRTKAIFTGPLSQDCFTRSDIYIFHLEGMLRTQEIMLREGLIKT